MPAFAIALLKADELAMSLERRTYLYGANAQREIQIFYLVKRLLIALRLCLLSEPPAHGIQLRSAFWAHFFGIQPICMMRGAEEYPEGMPRM